MTVAFDSEQRSAADVLDAVRELAPVIASRAAEVESARRVPADLLEKLKATGCFRITRPRSHGGLGESLTSAMRVFEELSRADASVAWIVGIGAGSWIDLAELPRSTFDALYPDGAEVVIGGVFAPTGVAIPVDGGYQVNGRWAFASGCEHSDWLYGNCIDASSGEPQLRMVVFFPSELEIEDTWSVSGLRGTGSHHIAAHDVFVPAERTFRIFADPPCVDAPVLRIPIPATFAFMLASVAIGIGQGALDDIVALATDKVPLLAGSALATNPYFQHQLGEADVKLRAARTLLYSEAGVAWETAEADGEFTPELRARFRSAAAWATTSTAAVVDTAYHAGGGSSLYDESPLQRRMRDIHAVTQHFLLKPDTLTTVGAILAGQDADLTVF
jgi:indole-3-acetate monooxygenase